MRPHNRTARGFTLFEVIIVIAVLSVLVAILTPRILVYIDDANVVRAQADVNAIAAAIEKMYEDTARWPFYADGEGPLSYASTTDYAVLSSDAHCDGDGAQATCIEFNPAELAGTDWALATARTDSLHHHLIMNAPGGVSGNAYRTTGRKAWQGPYLHRVPDVDPWGRSYVVNVANANPDEEGAGQKWVVVISGGPDGELDSDVDKLNVDAPEPLADDIIAYVK